MKAVWALVLLTATSGRAAEAPDATRIQALETQAADADRGGNLERGTEFRTKAIKLARESGRARVAAVLWVRVGRAYERANAVQQAVIAYEAGLKALDEENGLQVDADIASLRSTTKGFAGPKSSATGELRAEDLDGDLESAAADPFLVVKVLTNIGNAYARQPQFGPALKAYEIALARPEARDPSATRGHVLANRGEVLRRDGQGAAAAAALGEARTLLERYASPLERRRVLALIAGIERDDGKLDQAESTFRESLGLYSQLHDPRGEGRARAAYGRLLLARKKLDEANTAFGVAVACGRETSDNELLWQAYWGLGMSRRGLGDPNGAADALREAADRIEVWRGQLATDEGKVTFTEGAQEIMDALIGCHLDRAARNPAAYADALGAVERARGRALADLMAHAHFERGASQTTAVVRCRSGARLPGNDQEMAVGAPSAATIILEESNPERPGDAGESANPTNSPAQMAVGTRSASGPPPSAPRPVHPAMPRLVFHVLEDRTAIFAVTASGKILAHVAPIGRIALRERIALLRHRLDVDGPNRGTALDRPEKTTSAAGDAPPEDLLRELYADLIQPVAAGLPAAGTPLAIEPHDALWLLPFAALQAADRSWLIERWPLVEAPSQETLEAVRAAAGPGRPGTLRALVVGNPLPLPVTLSIDPSRLTLESLPGAEAEARRIGALVRKGRLRLLVGSEADLMSVVGLVKDQDIIHLATHAVAYGEDPLGSFVLLGDSSCGRLLTAREATALPLRAQLVVLSACQTGLGRISGDGMLGLARSFLVAGARSVIVSQWSVDDAATADLMTEFYSAYLKRREGKAEALRHAMMVLMRRRGFEHPRLWAPFIIVGSES